jgi:hypothetical protein
VEAGLAGVGVHDGVDSSKRQSFAIDLTRTPLRMRSWWKLLSVAAAELTAEFANRDGSMPVTARLAEAPVTP